MKQTKKIMVVSAVLLCTVALASAALIPFFGEIRTKASVQQSVTIDGYPYGTPLKHNIPDAVGGCCYTYEHSIQNIGCQGIWLDWDHTVAEGITVSVYEEESCCDHNLERLDLRVLDGIATWDDFEVFVDGVSVYSYDAQGGNPEDWIVHSVDLTGFELMCCGDHVVEICCTSDPWDHIDTYGQLAVDKIALYCEGDVLCDSVDIGNPGSELGHNLLGWGPVEPVHSGGDYGGVDDCRCTWEPDVDGLVSDASCARVTLTCEDCYESGDCECGQDHMITPFFLDAGESVDVCYTVFFSMMIMPGDYTIRSMLVPVDEV